MVIVGYINKIANKGFNVKGSGRGGGGWGWRSSFGV